MEKMNLPSDAGLMRIAIADLNNIFASFEQRSRALNELLVLVEPIDNANGDDLFLTQHTTTPFTYFHHIMCLDIVYFKLKKKVISWNKLC